MCSKEATSASDPLWKARAFVVGQLRPHGVASFGLLAKAPDSLALHRELLSGAVEIVNEVASDSKATTKLCLRGDAVRSDVDLHDPDAVAGLGAYDKSTNKGLG